MVLSFPKYLAISYYIKNSTFPIGSNLNDRRKLRYHAKRYDLTPGGRLLEKETAKELLHECNAFDVILKIHNEGHTGIALTRKKVLSAFAIHGIEKLVKNVVQGCETCQKTERRRKLRNNLGHPMPTPKTPFETVACDAVGPLNESDSGNKYILTAICHLTRFPIAKAVANINEETTLNFILEEIIVPYGCCKYFLTDRGANFTSDYVKVALTELGCTPLMTTSYRPQSNGVCERLNSSLASVLRKLCRDRNYQDKWDEMIPYALMVLRTTVNTSTGYTPSYLLHGYEHKTPATWTPPINDFVEGEEDDALAERCRRISVEQKEIWKKARKISDERKAKNKVNYDTRVHMPKGFNVGDKVLLKEMVNQEKLSDSWTGPYTILKVNHNGTVHLVGTNSRKLQGAVNGDRLKPYHEHRNMIPDVSAAHQTAYRRWISGRNKAYLVETPHEFKPERVVDEMTSLGFCRLNTHKQSHQRKKLIGRK